MHSQLSMMMCKPIRESNVHLAKDLLLLLLGCVQNEHFILILQPVSNMDDPFQKEHKKCILCKYNLDVDYKVWCAPEVTHTSNFHLTDPSELLLRSPVALA